MILVIDNYDSFVFNLARYFECAGWSPHVVRNDQITIPDIKKMTPEAIILSPGPCTPAQAGLCVDLIRQFETQIPILGVCLGHQAIGEAYNLKTIHAKTPSHGKSTIITHDGSQVFKAIPTPMRAGRYHSLAMQEPSQDHPLQVCARSNDGEIMAVRHKTHPVYGVQFHPESVLTDHGFQLIQNFKALCHTFHSQRKKAA